MVTQNAPLCFDDMAHVNLLFTWFLIIGGSIELNSPHSFPLNSGSGEIFEFIVIPVYAILGMGGLAALLKVLGVF